MRSILIFLLVPLISVYCFPQNTRIKRIETKFLHSVFKSINSIEEKFDMRIIKEYDPTGKILKYQSIGRFGIDTEIYTYNNVGQLKKVEEVIDGKKQKKYLYGYDTLGNEIFFQSFSKWNEYNYTRKSKYDEKGLIGWDKYNSEEILKSSTKLIKEEQDFIYWEKRNSKEELLWKKKSEYKSNKINSTKMVDYEENKIEYYKYHENGEFSYRKVETLNGVLLSESSYDLEGKIISYLESITLGKKYGRNDNKENYTIYEYNSNSDLIKESFFKNKKLITTLDFTYEYDNKGNWVSKLRRNSTPSDSYIPVSYSIDRRDIIYY